MPRTVLITGATGTVGSQLVHTLAKAGVRARALVRDDAKARSMLGDAADIVVGDLADEDAMRGALDRVDTLFLACGNVPNQVQLECAAIDAARSAGVDRVVKLSARGADQASDVSVWRGHAEIESHLTAAGLPAVIMRPSFYMTNLLAAATPVRQFNALPAAAGQAPIAMIDPADIAAVAARALFDDSVAGVLTLTGPEALSYTQKLTPAGSASMALGMILLGISVLASRRLVGSHSLAALAVGLYFPVQLVVQVAFFLNGRDAAPGPNGMLLGAWGLLWAWAAWSVVAARDRKQPIAEGSNSAGPPFDK